jgi:NADPH-dependent glutamate synthase beta subunit-like oxidoreductase
MINLTIDNQNVIVPEGTSILDAAKSAGIYIPVLCHFPGLPPFKDIELSEYIYQGNRKIENDSGLTIDSVKGCGICKVHVEGREKPVKSCKNKVENGMIIQTDSDYLKNARRQKLIRYIANHPHACLICSQREGCIPLTDVCASNVTMDERCCALLGKCELQRLTEYVGIAAETPGYKFRDLPKIIEDPLFIRDYNLCVSCGRCVRVCQSVKGVYALGAVIKDGELVVGTVNGPMLNDAACKFCGSCVEVCPTGAIQDKTKPRVTEESELVPCKSSCPGEVDIPLYLRLIAERKYQESGEVISSALPMPSVLGKICFHPCEVECRRGAISGKNDSASIRLLKDFAMSRYEPPPVVETATSTGKSVAVIGGGPAGLSAAYFLALKGHAVTIYEAKSELGGMLRYGIPRYRLPADILDKDIKQILRTGITVKTGTVLGADIAVQEIMESGTDAVFLALGLPNSKSLPVSGTDLENVLNGMEFLSKIASSEMPDEYFKSKSVVVIGGGNVAFDAARSALRLHAGNVTIVCLEQRNEMPAYKSEIGEAEKEGIVIRNGWGTSSFENSSQNKDEIDIALVKCTAVFDNEGRFYPVYDDSEREIISADYVIICIGQEVDSGSFVIDEALFDSATGAIKVNKETLETDVPGVFAGGDIVTGPQSVIDAVGAGRKAARSIDRLLGGDGIIERDYSFEDKPGLFIGRDNGFTGKKRVSPSVVDADKRKSGFIPVEETLSEEAAVAEAARCLRCDLRLCFDFNPSPPDKFTKFCIENIEDVQESAGVIQLIDDNKEVFVIKGCENVKQTLLDMISGGKNAAFFTFEYDPMFTKRESELMQQYMQKHGKMPTDEEDDLDDLF